MAKNSQVTTSNSYIGLITQGRDFTMNGNITINVPPEAKQNIEEFSLPRLINSFKGREQELTDLDSLLFVDNVTKVAISGIPGYGKSELAKQFAYQCKKNKRVDHVVWIKAETRDSLEKSSTKLRCIYEHFKEHKILFIFDNSESRNAISNFEPPDENNFYLLITSREKDFYDDVETFELENLSPDSAIDVFKVILCKFYNEEYKVLYEKLAYHVNYVPLGLQVTAAFVRQQIKRRGKHFNLSNYVDEIKSNQEKFIDDTIPNSIPNDYTKSLAGAVSLSIEKIQNEENESIEVRLLASNAMFDCAYLNPDDITIKDLFEMPNIKDLLKTDDNLLVESLSYIDNFCLIRYDPDDTIITMHRFIQQIIRFYLNKNNPEMKLSCYTSCVQFSMNMNLVGWKHGIIWKYTDDDEVMFYDNIYLKLIQKIKGSDKFMDIMQKLVEFNCAKTLKIVYENDWESKDAARLYIILNDFLHRAAEYNSLDVMKLFIENYDVDINGEGSDPWVWMSSRTPLLSAAKSGSIEAIKFLIQNNADVEVIDGYEGKTLLFILLERQSLKLDDIKEILDLVKSNDNTKTNSWGETLVHIAACHRRPDLIEYLVKSYNMDVNHHSRQSHTPLHKVVWFSNYCSHDEAIRTLNMLKQCGARLDLADNKGLTPLKLAEELSWSQFLIPYLTESEEVQQITPESKELEEVREPVLESPKRQEPSEHTSTSLSAPLMWCILSVLSSVILFFYYQDM